MASVHGFSVLARCTDRWPPRSQSRTQCLGPTPHKCCSQTAVHKYHDEEAVAAPAATTYAAPDFIHLSKSPPCSPWQVVCSVRVHLAQDEGSSLPYHSRDRKRKHS